MTAKTNNILYWISTLIFCALMVFSSLGGIQPAPQAVQLMHGYLGYPVYFIQFISIAKLLGVIAVLVPGTGRIKDWAYAGMFFDLAGAVYSGVAVSSHFDPRMLTLLAWVVPGIVSYYCWRKKSVPTLKPPVPSGLTT